MKKNAKNVSGDSSLNEQDAALDDAVMGLVDDDSLDLDDVSAEADMDVDAEDEADADDSTVADAEDDADDTDENEDADEDDDAEEDDESDDADEDDDAEDEGDDPRSKRRDLKFEKRISKEVAKRKAAEESARRYEAELKALRDEAAESKAAGAFDEIADLAGVVKARKKLRAELDTLEEGIEKGELEINGQVYESATLRKWRREVREELEDVLPAVERRILRREEVNRDQVARVYPELLEKGSDLQKEAERILGRVPGLKRDPEGLLLVGDLLRGRRLRMNAGKKKPLGKADRGVVRKAPRDPGRDAGSRRVVRSPRAKDPERSFEAEMERIALERGML